MKHNGSFSMHCPACGHNRSRVVSKYNHDTLIQRRRWCMKCHHKFNTQETAITPNKKDTKCN